MKITEDEKRECVEMYKTGRYYIREIAEWLGISVPSVMRIVREDYGKTNKR